MQYHSKSIRLVNCVFMAALSMLIPIAGYTQPSSQPKNVMTESVVTVDQLVSIENKVALAKAKKEAEAAGLIGAESDKTKTTQIVAVPPATFNVMSVYGIEGNLRANANYNGQIYEGLRVGAPVGKCSVTNIAPRSVKLSPAGGISSSQCPIGVWTGEATSIASAVSTGGAVVAMPSGPLPPGLLGDQQRRFEPAADMRLTQPVAAAARLDK